MSPTEIPLLLETEHLQTMLDDKNFLIIDLSDAPSYQQIHIPTAIHLKYSDLIRGISPAVGLLPTTNKIQTLMSTIGLRPNRHIIAYDNEGGGRACRMLWTLDIVGHRHKSLLNGGLRAWIKGKHPTEQTINQPQPSHYKIRIHDQPQANKAYVLNSLHDPEIVLLDARSRLEYQGSESPSQRKGKIPGARNLNWYDTMDKADNLRFKPDQILHQMLDTIGITPNKQIITYCQTHHRSSHSYIMLKHLGFPNIKGYAGSWAEWGNDPNLPIE